MTAHPAANLRPTWLPAPVIDHRSSLKEKRWINFALVLLVTTIIYTIVLIRFPELRQGILNFSSSWTYVVPAAIAYFLLNLYALFAVFSPAPDVKCNPVEVVPGGRIQIEWQIKGWQGGIRKLKVELVCTEHFKPTRHAGKGRRHEAARFRILETTNPHEILRGQSVVTIPMDAMHSLYLRELSPVGNYRCGIRWELEFKGDVALFPDFIDRMEVIVLPVKMA